LGVEVIGGGDARRLRHVLDDDGRLAGKIFRQIFDQKPGAEIVVVARREAGDQAELLVLVKVFRMRAGTAKRRGDKQANRKRRLGAHARYSAARLRASASAA